MIIVALVIIAVLGITPFFYIKQAKFGRAPGGARLEIIKKSPNYKNGSFKNLNHTPQLTPGYTIPGVLYEFLFKKAEGRSPLESIPSVKTDLKSLPGGENVLIWFGHSSYFIQIDGKRILVDPVFSGNASPISGTNKSFKGTDIYTVEDLPEIDYLFITHDHYDHVDYKTIIELRPKARKVICGLGVGAHFEHWGYSADNIIEKDWYEKIDLGDGFVVYTTPARHFSGRAFSRNNTLWLSYVLQTPTMRIYIGGDSGYDTHYADIGQKFGPFDLAILENGQYDKKWVFIHNQPEDALQAAKDLKAARLFPVHSSKFMLANHRWDEPLVRITEANKKFNIPLLTPMIGEVVNLKDKKQETRQWWTSIK